MSDDASTEPETPPALSPDQEDIRAGKDVIDWQDAYARCRYMRGQKLNKKDELTDFQEIFVNEYMLDFNGRQAYIRARGTGKMESAAARAADLLKVEKVAKAVEELKLERIRRLDIQKQQIIEELANITHVDAATDFRITNRGKIRARKGRNPMSTRAISGVKHKISTTTIGDETTVEHTVEYRTFDKNTSARTLLQHLGALPEHVRVGGPNGEALPSAVLVIKEVSETSSGENTKA